MRVLMVLRLALCHSLFVVVMACQRLPPAEGSSDETTTTDGTSLSGSVTTEGTAGPGTTQGSETSGDFIVRPDGGECSCECDICEQDCPKGEKCSPWANDGGNAWNATKCTPLDPTPKGVDEPCTVEGHAASGVDDCDISMMCWDVDPRTNMGHCIPFCNCGKGNVTCDDRCRACVFGGDAVLYLCLPRCNPLAQDCLEGEGCYPHFSGFICAPDTSGPDTGVYGDPCEFLNACDVGLFCAYPELVPGCEVQSCCTPYCDPLDADCPDASLGVECVAWFDDIDPVPACTGAGTIGICILPQP